MRERDASLTALRMFREVAERGTLTAAATALGYTQSAVSRQIASLERGGGRGSSSRSGGTMGCG
ncbi:LysR family transcriptional regulator [Nocardia niigatensis]|uniref:LysR family transcriptional regulator n=1 Tax=Nocardia niigatensis TaxID=209249 RepID=UPI0005950749